MNFVVVICSKQPFQTENLFAGVAPKSGQLVFHYFFPGKVETVVPETVFDRNIVVDISRPFVRIHDDGSGIDPSVEHAIFEPFVSAKAKGQGRGLGLFIVKQLLDSEGCSIGLLPERNKRGRFYKFQIDLRGALHE